MRASLGRQQPLHLLSRKRFAGTGSESLLCQPSRNGAKVQFLFPIAVREALGGLHQFGVCILIALAAFNVGLLFRVSVTCLLPIERR